MYVVDENKTKIPTENLQKYMTKNVCIILPSLGKPVDYAYYCEWRRYNHIEKEHFLSVGLSLLLQSDDPEDVERGKECIKTALCNVETFVVFDSEVFENLKPYIHKIGGLENYTIIYMKNDRTKDAYVIDLEKTDKKALDDFDGYYRGFRNVLCLTSCSYIFRQQLPIMGLGLEFEPIILSSPILTLLYNKDCCEVQETKDYIKFAFYRSSVVLVFDDVLFREIESLFEELEIDYPENIIFFKPNDTNNS